MSKAITTALGFFFFSLLSHSVITAFHNVSVFETHKRTFIHAVNVLLDVAQVCTALRIWKNTPDQSSQGTSYIQLTIWVKKFSEAVFLKKKQNYYLFNFFLLSLVGSGCPIWSLLGKMEIIDHKLQCCTCRTCSCMNSFFCFHSLVLYLTIWLLYTYSAAMITL